MCCNIMYWNATQCHAMERKVVQCDAMRCDANKCKILKDLECVYIHIYTYIYIYIYVIHIYMYYIYIYIYTYVQCITLCIYIYTCLYTSMSTFERSLISFGYPVSHVIIISSEQMACHRSRCLVIPCSILFSFFFFFSPGQSMPISLGQNREGWVSCV